MRIEEFNSQAIACARIFAIALGFTIPISGPPLNYILLVLTLTALVASGNFRDKLAAVKTNQVALAALALFGFFIIGLAWNASGINAGLHMVEKYSDLAFVPIFVTLFQTERDRRRALLAFAAALVLTLFLSYLTWAGLISKGFLVLGDEAKPEVFKKYLTQNILMAFGAFLFGHFALTARTRSSRVAWSVIALLAVINVVLMVPGRSGQLILAALAIYFAYSVWRRAGALLAAAGVVALGAALILGFAPVNNRLALLLEEWNTWQPGVDSQTSMGQRLGYFHNSLLIIRDHPVIGVGTGGFSKAYADQVAGTTLTPTDNPHNEYLNVTVQLGVIGLSALLYLFYCIWRLAPELPAAFEFHLARGLIVTIALGCLLNSLLMDHVEGLLFAWVTGVLFAGMKSQTAKEEAAAA
jgi:O-antigen ligase